MVGSCWQWGATEVSGIIGTSTDLYRKRKAQQFKRSHGVQSSTAGCLTQRKERCLMLRKRETQYLTKKGRQHENKHDSVAMGGSRIINLKLQQYTPSLTTFAYFNEWCI